MYYNSERSEVSTRTQTKMYGFIHIPHILVTKYRSCSPYAYQVAFHRRPTLRLPNMDFYLQKNTERLQVSRFAGFYLSCSKVRVNFISSPIFPITSCCFFVLLIHIKCGFLFSENLIPSTLCSFGELHSLDGSNVQPTKNGRPLLNFSC